MFRIFQASEDPVITADTVEQIAQAIQAAKPGQYLIDEFRVSLLPSKEAVHRWGVGIKRADGFVAIETDPWPRAPASGIAGSASD